MPAFSIASQHDPPQIDARVQVAEHLAAVALFSLWFPGRAYDPVHTRAQPASMYQAHRLAIGCRAGWREAAHSGRGVMYLRMSNVSHESRPLLQSWHFALCVLVG